jgi:TetR/AcrR family acrAB operon transcriptional repressor
MVRRTRSQAAATRVVLLDAAEHVFRAKGVAHATLADVALAAGLTRGAVYWHFRDKADLVAAVCNRVTLPAEAMRAAPEATSGDDPLGELRAQCVHGLVQLATCPRTQAVFDVMFRRCEQRGESAPLGERQCDMRDDCVAQVKRALDRAVALRQLPAATDTRLAAEGIHAFMTGLMYQWVGNTAAFDLERAAPALIDAHLAGLRAHPPRRAAHPAKARSSTRLRAQGAARR